MSNIWLYGYTTFCLSILQLKDIWVISTSVLTLISIFSPMVSLPEVTFLNTLWCVTSRETVTLPIHCSLRSRRVLASVEASHTSDKWTVPLALSSQVQNNSLEWVVSQTPSPPTPPPPSLMFRAYKASASLNLSELSLCMVYVLSH